MMNIKQPIIFNWIAASALFITVVGAASYIIFHTGQTLKGIEHIEQSLEKMTMEMNVRFNNVDQRMKKMEDDIGDLKVGVAELNVKFDYLEKRGSNLEGN